MPGVSCATKSTSKLESAQLTSRFGVARLQVVRVNRELGARRDTVTAHCQIRGFRARTDGCALLAAFFCN
jgi:hypothetical protein